jgi:prolyl-tRNA synthetase
MKNSPGHRYAEYELRGVPVRVEIGPKDISKGACAVARRDVPGKEGKQFDIPLAGAAAHIDKLLRDIQASLFARAKAYRDAGMQTADSYDQFKEQIEKGGFVWAHWDGTRETENKVQEETKATIRCIPFDGDPTPGACMVTGGPSARRVAFARAY